MCGFIAQLVEHRTGIAEVTGSNPVEALIFFRLLLSNCLNWKIYCDDHTSLHFSYDEKRNNDLNFSEKIRKLQTKLDMWSSRDLTIFRRVMILKILGLSQLVYSASNFTVPQGTADLVKTKLFRFLWRNKKDKIKRSGLYQDPDRGGIHMTDTNIMFKALKLAWIPRLIKSVNSNWCSIPNHFFKGVGGLNFLLRCNYVTKHFKDLPVFY